MSKKCVAFSKSKLGLEKPDNKKAFYAGWAAALSEQAEQEPVGTAGELFTMSALERLDVRPSTKVYLNTAPVRTKDLTNDEIISDLGADMDTDEDKAGFLEIARIVIAADREKNK